MLNKAIEACTYLLNNFPEAQNCRDYLDSRLSKESQEKFCLGYFPDINNISAITDITGKDYLLEHKLLRERKFEDIRGPNIIDELHFEHFPLIIPFHDPYGNIAGAIGRTLLNDEERGKIGLQKYKYTSFKKSLYLYGLFQNKQSIIDNNSVYIVEGQFDVIKATEYGINNIVALGTSNMTDYQFSVILRYTDNIFLLLDNDSSGENGRKKIINNFGKYANIQNFYLPEEYKDIDDYFSKTNDKSISFVIKG